MPKRRVVITGMGAVSPYGLGSELLFSRLHENVSAVAYIKDLEAIHGLWSHVAGIVPEIGIKDIPRNIRRSMSPMSAYAYLAAQEALSQAGIEKDAIQNNRFGISLGSTLGSPEALEEFFKLYLDTSGVEQVKSMFFFRIMSHSAAANLAQSLGVSGRVLAPSSACSSGCQSIGLGYEAIAYGRQDYMLCGGTDEFHPLVTGTFDILRAASTACNDAPEHFPRPFDAKRDGVVCSEGAGLLLLESLDSAQQREAPIFAEILGFASTSDTKSIAEPSSEPIAICMSLALKDAGVDASEIAYINAHATGTELGDIAESQGIYKVFGDKTPVSSLKGHLGHTMAASGALESVATIRMLQEKVFLPTKNLDNPDPKCANINLLQKPVEATAPFVIKNSFALGGINCSLVLRGFQ